MFSTGQTKSHAIGDTCKSILCLLSEQCAITISRPFWLQYFGIYVEMKIQINTTNRHFDLWPPSWIGIKILYANNQFNNIRFFLRKSMLLPKKGTFCLILSLAALLYFLV